MKSSRQKRIEKHAKMPKRDKQIKYAALVISATLLAIPIYLTYVFG